MQRVRQALWLLRSGGIRALARALFGRFVFRRWRVRLFQDPEAERQPAAWPDGYRYELHPARGPATASAAAVIAQAGADGLLADLDAVDRIYFVRHGEEIASYGAVFTASPQRSILGLPADAVLIGGCATLERHRSRSLYRLALNDTVRELRKAGVARIYVEVRPENEASIRGVLGARFADLGIVDAAIWFGACVWRDGGLHRLRRGAR